MGHWTEGLVDELVQRFGESLDRQTLTEIAFTAGREIEILYGRTFRCVVRLTSTIEPNGLPMVDVPNVYVGSVESGRNVWEIPDPVDPKQAAVLQLLPLEPPVTRATSVGEALSIAGQIIAEASRSGCLTAPYVLHWLANAHEPEQIKNLFRRLMDPAVRFHVPILSRMIEGWWFQISRRVLVATRAIEDEGRLLEWLLPDEGTTGCHGLPLVAVEPVLIVARATQQPIDWALTARIWPAEVERPSDRRWSVLANAVHTHGVPIITVDSNSTPSEIACQVVLKGYWHGYIDGNDAALAKGVELAYPHAVESILRRTGAPNPTSAAAMLLEQLVHPGFDPAQGAEMTRRYVRRKVSIVVMEHRKREHPERYPWTKVGISERRFYKLLPLFAKKVNGRYDYDHDEVIEQMKAHLNSKDRDRQVRAAALEVLRSHGFKEEAARKWLQRHRLEDAVDAWPRGRRPNSAVVEEPALLVPGVAR